VSPSLSLTRTVGFRATHRFYRPDWSDGRNRDVFGPIAEPGGHAHDYQCAVTVRGPVDEFGSVIDLTLLDRILKEEVVTPLSGKHLNDLPDFVGGRPIPTCEAMAAYLFRRIAPCLPAGVALERVRIMEDPSLYAECTGLA
jgi:6-pyruvoyltetrahydropterin/6-carboxytetrahydropterin synthase